MTEEGRFEKAADLDVGDLGLHFSHEAMATVFEVFICSDRPDYTTAAARAVFDQVDALEALLSRYIPNSDISRINGAIPGRRTVVSPETIECLLAAKRAWLMTGGAFDCTIGRLADRYKDKCDVAPAVASAGMDTVVIDSQAQTVVRRSDAVSLDLGGIGKGYALQKGVETFKEWDIACAFLSAGSSTVFAMGAPEGRAGWPAIIRNPQTGGVLESLELAHKALSCSGVRSCGHIIDPRTSKPAAAHTVCWLTGPEPAMCDALSTGLMVMPQDKIDAFVCANPQWRIIAIY